MSDSVVIEYKLPEGIQNFFKFGNRRGRMVRSGDRQILREVTEADLIEIAQLRKRGIIKVVSDTSETKPEPTPEPETKPEPTPEPETKPEPTPEPETESVLAEVKPRRGRKPKASS